MSQDSFHYALFSTWSFIPLSVPQTVRDLLKLHWHVFGKILPEIEVAMPLNSTGTRLLEHGFPHVIA